MRDLIARRYVISGRVQGVGFRYFAERSAERWGIAGWVRNLPDGRVEVQAEGTRDHLAQFERDLRRGPSRAEVRGFESVESAAEGAKGFEIR
jgi:acylphosphatase